MPNKKAAEIKINEHEKKILSELKNGSHVPQHLKKRSEIILLASAGESNSEISKKIQMKRENVAKWRNRYAVSNEELRKTEEETPKKLRGMIDDMEAFAEKTKELCELYRSAEELEKNGVHVYSSDEKKISQNTLN